MCDVPFLPIFPICFQCGTDQNPCRCKVLGPTLGFCVTIVAAVCTVPIHYLLSCVYLLWLLFDEDGKGVSLLFFSFSFFVLSLP
ncbi:hypothetical protein ANOM_010935, partial [Aspergillus nomiae NRRL 13137]